MGAPAIHKGSAAVARNVEVAAGKVGTAFQSARIAKLFNIPISEYNAIRSASVHYPSADTMILGKYMDGGAGSYVTIAENARMTYFSLGATWDAIKSKYFLTDANMFQAFNIPALDAAARSHKVIKFTHNPLLEGGALLSEWKYLMKNYGYTNLVSDGGFWIAK